MMPPERGFIPLPRNPTLVDENVRILVVNVEMLKGRDLFPCRPGCHLPHGSHRMLLSPWLVIWQSCFKSF